MKNPSGRSNVLLAYGSLEVEWYPSVEQVPGIREEFFRKYQADFRQDAHWWCGTIWMALSPLILFGIGETFWAFIPWLGAFATDSFYRMRWVFHC